MTTIIIALCIVAAGVIQTCWWAWCCGICDHLCDENSVPAQWQWSISGVGDLGGCTGADMDGNYTVTYTNSADECKWTEGTVPSLSFVSFGPTGCKMQTNIIGLNGATYDSPSRGDADCIGDNDLDLTTEHACQSWPDPVTVSPV